MILRARRKAKEEPSLIGLTGTNGAGKGEAAAFFQRKGYAYFSLSDVIREALEKRAQQPSRSNMIQMGNKIREEFGADILARRIMEKVEGKAVIDSIRNPQEVAFLRKQEGFVLIAIDAPVELRYERAKKRGREESASSLEEFIAKENEEMANQEKGQQLNNCMALADIKIINDGILKSLYQKLERFL
jgi:dephospho-CoA kinase